MYKYLVSGKIRFLDDILYFLESKLELQSENELSLGTCHKANKNKLSGITYSFKSFLPKDRERLYLRVAMIYLEKENLIIKQINLNNVEVPDYLISYSGIVLVRNGGYSKKFVLDKLKEFLQRLAWFVTVLALILNLYINKEKFIFFDTSNTLKKVVKQNQLQKKQVLLPNQKE